MQLRATLPLCLALALVATAGCKRTPRREDGPAPAPPTPDQLAPGELAEGTEKAFGLPLPRVMQVNVRQADAVYAWTSIATPEEVSNYVRARVQEGEVFVGTSSTRYVGVHPRASKETTLTVEVRAGVPGSGSRATIVVRNQTPTPLEPDLDKRLKGAGITQDGKMRDRNQRE